MPINFVPVTVEEAAATRKYGEREVTKLADAFIADMAAMLSDDLPALLTVKVLGDDSKVDYDKSVGITWDTLRDEYRELADAIESGEKYSLDTIVRRCNLKRDDGGIGGKLDVYCQRNATNDSDAKRSGSLIFKRYSVLVRKPKENGGDDSDAA